MAIDKDAALKRAEKFLRQGKLAGAIEEYVRLVEESPRDWAAINALGDLYVRAGDVDRAVEQFHRVADFLFTEGFLPKAQAVYKKALKVHSTQQHTLTRLAEIAVRQGLTADARQYLAQVRDQDRVAELLGDPGLLLAIAARELAAGKDEGLQRVMRAIAQAPERAPEVVRLAIDLAGQGQPDRAFACLDIVVDAALLEGDLQRAAAQLNEFVQTTPHIPALTKLVEVCVDAGLSWMMREAQGRLAEAYQAAGREAEARAILADLEMGLEAAETPGEVVDDDFFADLGARTPEPAMSMAAVEPPRIAEPESKAAQEPAPPAAPVAAAAPPAPIAPAAPAPDDVVAIETLEIDLSAFLSDLESSPTLPPVAAAPAIETVFEGMRTRLGKEGQASGSDQVETALNYLHEGREDEAMALLQDAARTPAARFKAAAQLGGLYLRRGDLSKGIEWMERAAEAPAATPEEGFTLLYQLGAALERAGESARALAILLELDADAPGYRDVRDRIARLTSHSESPAQ